MPELPEAQTMVLQLRSSLLDRTIVRVEIMDRKRIDSALVKTVRQAVISVDRRGKAIIVELSRHQFLFIRLGMTGHFYYAGPDDAVPGSNRHAALRLSFEDNSQLTFYDPRRFGSVRLLDRKELQRQLQRFGPEPLSPDFTSRRWNEMVRSRPNSTVKMALMDQGFIAGVGNIYAQEALYRAAIDPRRKMGNLRPPEITALHTALRETLRSAIAQKGTSVLSYLHLDGAGNFQNFLRVYQKERCPRNHPLKRMYLGSRGTYFCQKCQK
jgi:formamidopyrimidine-DNA glycosylase